ncbi:hypothetical protein CHS0354_020531 [Potamilus streckersoni]|uniref:Uncharacterized protein n=1 Tax=Potamilus streckersoni TaxID=2493646 RepID=A0AAE0W042_9BIVA|nr:hypothetical protein CHS0354_020531 [Potamilus streckersoni]
MYNSTNTKQNTFNELETESKQPKGKQPLKGPPRSKNPKYLRKENITSKQTINPTRTSTPKPSTPKSIKRKFPQINQTLPTKIPRQTQMNSTQEFDNIIEEFNQEPTQTSQKDNTNNSPNKTIPHPRYLTLYLKYPTNPHKQRTDSAIQLELLKHKQGQIKRIHTKSLNTIIWCFLRAQIKAYKKITQIDNVPKKTVEEAEQLTRQQHQNNKKTIKKEETTKTARTPTTTPQSREGKTNIKDNKKQVQPLETQKRYITEKPTEA